MKYKDKKTLFAELCFLCFFFVAFLVKLRSLVSLDHQATTIIQTFIPRSLDTILSFFSLVGSFEAVFILLSFLLFQHFKRLTRLIPILFLFLLGHLIEFVGKSFIFQIGPPEKDIRYNIEFVFPSASVQPGNSFPSGHAFRMLFVAVIVCAIIFARKFSRKTKYLLLGALFLISIVMLVSRVSLGEHWTSDVLGGSFLGAGFGFLSLFFL